MARRLEESLPALSGLDWPGRVTRRSAAGRAEQDRGPPVEPPIRLRARFISHVEMNFNHRSPTSEIPFVNTTQSNKAGQIKAAVAINQSGTKYRCVAKRSSPRPDRAIRRVTAGRMAATG